MTQQTETWPVQKHAYQISAEVAADEEVATSWWRTMALREGSIVTEQPHVVEVPQSADYFIAGHTEPRWFVEGKAAHPPR